MPKSTSRAADFIGRRAHQLKSRRSQGEIARIAGFISENMISQLKAGTAKVPLARVPDLAQALDSDVGHLMRLALEQHLGADVVAVIIGALGGLISANEMRILERIREHSKNGDPGLTPRVDELLAKAFEAK
jgi:hypothetical protein